MSRPLPSRRRKRRRSSTPPPASPGATTSRAPRASRLGIAFALFLGLFLGRAFSDNFSASTLGLIDLVMFAGLAATLALGFRRWARRTIEERERRRLRQQERRRSRPAEAETMHLEPADAEPADGERSDAGRPDEG